MTISTKRRLNESQAGIESVLVMRNAVFLIILLAIFSCKNDGGTIKNLVEEKIDYDKYDDYYKNFQYTNKKLGLKIQFDSEWSILTQFKDFEAFQKKYVRYVTTEKSEVLFLGSDDTKKIGVRCYCETGGISNEDFLKKIKDLNVRDMTSYDVAVKKEEKTVLRNFEAVNFVIQTSLNKKNIFVFDSILFKNQGFNYRLDFWCSQKNYDLYKDYIFNLYQQVDFQAPEE
jgi:hypothetical protein